MLIKEKLVPKMLVASTQHFVKDVSDELIEQFTNDFEKYFAETEARKKEPQNFFTVFHVDTYREKDYEMELWVQVETAKHDTENVFFKDIPQSETVYVTVSESYENLGFAYDALFDYVREHELIINGYPRETYIFDDNAPLGYLTEIQLPFNRNAI